jgi:hypothetical protein
VIANHKFKSSYYDVKRGSGKPGEGQEPDSKCTTVLERGLLSYTQKFSLVKLKNRNARTTGS